MSDDTLPVLCGRCRVEIEEAEEADSIDLAFCPSCGISETLEAIQQEVNQFLEDHLTDDGASEADDHGHASEFSPDDEPRSYRFVVDLDYLRSEVWSHAEEPIITDTRNTPREMRLAGC